MCGFVGFCEPNGLDLERKIERMSSRLVHRGPDDSGAWIEPSCGLAFGFRRLAIVDLSALGHQPMSSRTGRLTIVFNGEIYNFRLIARELEALGERFNGGSDTEVLLAALERWGVEAALKRCVGMFAFAVWDRDARTLTLARDRVGKKPLYYGWHDGVFFFASELKALREHPRFRPEIDRNVLGLYMRHGYIPAPYSIYRGIFKLQPGWALPLPVELLHGRPALPGQGGQRPIIYWSLADRIQELRRSPFHGTDEEALDEFERLLSEAVGLRMIADVPLGAFLSGGIDSSLIVSLMQAQSGGPVRTFSIGFHERGYDEAAHARRVAAHLGTEHTELYVTPQETLDVIPRLPELFDEPFADSSEIPTFLVSQLARRHVTVSLSGDGGDELFCGYTRYRWGDVIWRALSPFPASLRRGIGASLAAVPPSLWECMAKPFRALFPDALSFRDIGGKVERTLALLGMPEFAELYQRMVSTHNDPLGFVRQAQDLMTPIIESRAFPSGLNRQEQMMYVDALTYLPDDILVKVDRSSMGVSLEARAPLLDHRVMEFSWKLPMRFKTRDGTSKWIMRRLLSKFVPATLFERPKMGFGVPVEHWLRRELRGWAGDLLSEARLAREGFFDPQRIQRIWREHSDGRANRSSVLWAALMFEAWLEKNQSQ